MEEKSEFKSPLNYSDRKMWIADTIKHPAKIHLGMLEAIILEYTKEGGTILDCMAGTGSTGIIAMLHNRNCIMVEYEEKFCKTAKENIKLNKKQSRLQPLGHAEIIRGDARLLSRMFKDKADGVVMSPPYSESLTKRRKGYTNIKGLEDTRQLSDTQDDNIANLSHGDIDSVVFSPPFAGTVAFQDNKWMQEHEGELAEKFRREHPNHPNPPGNVRASKYRYKLEEKYSSNPNNIGNLKYGDISAIKGQTYLEAMKMVYQGCYDVLKENGIMVLITKNFIRQKKVIPLDQHTIKLCESVGFTFVKRHYRKITKPSFWRTLYKKKYGLEIPYEDILVFRKQRVIN